MSRCHHPQLLPLSMVVGCSVHSVEVKETMRSMFSRAVYISTLDPHHERHRDHNRIILSQQSTSVCDKRIGRYPNVFAGPRSWWSCHIKNQSWTQAGQSYWNVYDRIWTKDQIVTDCVTWNWQVVTISHPSPPDRTRTYQLASPLIQTWHFREVPSS